MANVILFTDISPVAPWKIKQIKWIPQSYSYPAGAHKLASHLRNLGITVTVIPNCLSFTLAGIKQIIDQNSKDLLWAGISTTFLTTKAGSLLEYRKQWAALDSPILENNVLFDINLTNDLPTQLVWGDQEMSAVGSWIKEKYNVPFLIGGAWVSTIDRGNLQELDENCYIVTGNAETFVENFTLARKRDNSCLPPYVNDNKNYDDMEFKSSQMIWTESDLVDQDMWLPLEISRGCAFNCAYCEYDRKNSTDFYKRSNVLREELIRNYEKFGVTKYMLVDDLYNDNKNKVRRLYDEVWSRLPFQPEWISYMRLDMFWADPESAEFIKNSGARVGGFGIETLHDRAGKKVGKGLGKKRILETLEMLNAAWKTDVLIHGLFIAGLPYEPMSSIIETMEWTRTTPLLYSHGWAPMWITPPKHFEIVKNFNDISEHNEKYGIEWMDPDTWVNSEGVNSVQVKDLVSDYYKNLDIEPRTNWRSYPEVRSAGFSHSDLINLSQLPDLEQKLTSYRDALKEKLDRRIQKILELQDNQ